VSRFRFVEDHQRTVGVKRLCQVPRVSRSGFYAGDIDLLEAGLPGVASASRKGDPDWCGELWE
jgi:hypothetical protein